MNNFILFAGVVHSLLDLPFVEDSRIRLPTSVADGQQMQASVTTWGSIKLGKIKYTCNRKNNKNIRFSMGIVTTLFYLKNYVHTKYSVL